jgi:hypothetical protein
MDNSRTNLEKLVVAFQAKEACPDSGKYSGVIDRWETLIEKILNTLPSGGGFAGTEVEKVSSKKVILVTEFHHFSEQGHRRGVTSHKITFTPTLVGTSIKVSGKNFNDVKPYITEVFYNWASSVCWYMY